MNPLKCAFCRNTQDLTTYQTAIPSIQVTLCDKCADNHVQHRTINTLNKNGKPYTIHTGNKQRSRKPRIDLTKC